MARTSGVCASEAGLASLTSVPLSVLETRWRNRDTQDDDAGLHTCGVGPPSRPSFQPAARASAAPPDALLNTLTSAHLPPNLRSLELYRPANSVSSAAFSLDAAMVSATQPPRVVALLP